jgi:hypothetical protein
MIWPRHPVYRTGQETGILKFGPKNKQETGQACKNRKQDLLQVSKQVFFLRIYILKTVFLIIYFYFWQLQSVDTFFKNLRKI